MSTEPYLPSSSEYVVNALSLVTHGKFPSVATTENSPAANRSDEGFQSELSRWCVSVWKRGFDLVCVVPALVLISPILGIIAIAVRLTSPGPVIFRQRRAGQHRKLFTIYKFRTMVENSEAIGPGHTAKGDPRVTTLGWYLRRFKLDELPQLYNVLLGDMSLVGPRPKLPNHEFVPMRCRPGVTGAATLAFRYESQILCNVPPSRIESFYQSYIVPLKLRLDRDYMQTATIFSDVVVLVATLLRIGKHVTHEDLLQSSSAIPISGQVIPISVAR